MWTRRTFLKTGGLALVTFGAGPAFLARAAAATSGSGGRRRTLVAIFQRGAMDGLMAVPPLGSPELSSLRPRLGMSAARTAGEEAVIDLGVGFGLHPAFAPLAPWFREGQLAIVHAVGSPDPTRSHFDAQDYMEAGTPGRKGTPSGWLNRAVALAPAAASSPFRAMALTPALPRSLYGDAPALAVADLAAFRLQSPGAVAAATSGEGFEALYEATAQRLLRDAGNETFEAAERLRALDVERYRPASGASYPAGPLGKALRQIAQLIKADVGLEVAFAESTGWDTHVQQGTTQGAFARAGRELATAIDAFWTDLGERRADVVLSTMTEFGRTARENGSGGTDHGHGSCLFVLGENAIGGKVHGTFPGLAPESLFEGRDLAVTTDFRSVFAELAAGHLGVADPKALFPGWSGARLPLLRRA
ncbi:MAG TPA: DUF1501 domain-containing protein [Thermoanaerobaculia bacterium]|nr:DUF1501 domain-containing protein [Thermoanaerobaculia bacterium]